MAEEEPKNIEDLVREIYGNASKDDKKNIQQFEDHYKQANQDKIQNRLVGTALEGDPNSDVKGAYHSAATQIDKQYSGGKVDVKDDEKLHRVLVSYISGYFEHAKPSVMKALPEHLKKPLDQLSKDEVKDLYQTLAHHFDQETGANENPSQNNRRLSGLDARIKAQFEDEEEVTADMLKEYLHGMVGGHRSSVMEKLNEHPFSAYLKHLPHGLYAANVLDRVKKSGKEISPANEANFIRTSVDSIAENISIPLVRRGNPNYRAHGFYDKKQEEKES